MNGGSSIHSLPSASSLSNALVIFLPESWWRPFLVGYIRPRRPKRFKQVFLNWGRERARASKPKKGLAAAGARMPLGRDHFADFRLAASCCVFFPLGFKFCCMVLRVANALALIIDLQRLCYLQLVQWISTQAGSDNSWIFLVSNTMNCTLSFFGITVGSEWVMDLKATAWRWIVITPFGDYFGKAL